MCQEINVDCDDTMLLTISDFDGDDMISTSDLKEIINRLTGEQNCLGEEYVQQLIDNVRRLCFHNCQPHLLTM